MYNDNKRNYNFNNIGDLLDYRKYLYKEIKEYSKYIGLSTYYYLYYVRYCIGLLKIVNILINKKGYK